jgi:hypothetical protein
MAKDFKGRNSLDCGVEFLGVWDTVKAYGWLNPQSFPALRHNPSVRVVRHAVALDERRALFKMTGWGDGHLDVKEVWFAGDHSDVGGGHEDGNSPLADASLRWMLGEATQNGLRLNPEKKSDVSRIVVRSAEAPGAAPRDLWLRRGFIVLDCMPRVELENSLYPPQRLKRFLWSDGGRKPGDHAFANATRFLPNGGVSDSHSGAYTVTIHHTVEVRLHAREKRYAHQRLIQCSKGRGPKAIQLEVERDLEIQWHDGQ